MYTGLLHRRLCLLPGYRKPGGRHRVGSRRRIPALFLSLFLGLICRGVLLVIMLQQIEQGHPYLRGRLLGFGLLGNCFLLRLLLLFSCPGL